MKLVYLYSMFCKPIQIVLIQLSSYREELILQPTDCAPNETFKNLPTKVFVVCTKRENRDGQQIKQFLNLPTNMNSPRVSFLTERAEYPLPASTHNILHFSHRLEPGFLTLFVPWTPLRIW